MPNKLRRCFRLSRYLVAGSVALLALPALGQDQHYFLSGGFGLSKEPGPAKESPVQGLFWWYPASGSANEVPVWGFCVAEVLNETTEGLKGVGRVPADLTLEHWGEVQQRATTILTESGKTGRNGQIEFTVSSAVENSPGRHYLYSETKTDGRKRVQGVGTTCVQTLVDPGHLCEGASCFDGRWVGNIVLNGVLNSWEERGEKELSFPEVSDDQGPINVKYFDNCDRPLLQERNQGFEISGITSDEVKIVITDTKTGEVRIAQRELEETPFVYFGCP